MVPKIFFYYYGLDIFFSVGAEDPSLIRRSLFSNNT